MSERRPVLPRRPREAHKGDFGRLLIVAGSEGLTGAPALAAKAAVRGGVGLVTLAVPREIYSILAVKCCDETMVWPIPKDLNELQKKAAACDAVVIGPGLGQSERAEELVCHLLQNYFGPVIVDADGLNILSRHIDILNVRAGVTVLTPHEGEFARLSGCKLPMTDRMTDARAFAADHRCVLVLKGHRTITALPDGQFTVNMTGNPGMARGGSGDALAGLLGAFLAQWPENPSRLADAVWIHGRAGDIAAAEMGEYGMTVSDLIERLPCAMRECEEE